jgi:urease accessory protein
MFVDAQQAPWAVIRAFPGEDGGALVHLNNVSGGVVAGDRLSLSVNVGPGSMAQVTSTGATRLYRHRVDSQESTQHIELNVAEDALLEYLPDAIIPFAGSRHRQSTSIALAEGAILMWWDILAPGRQAMGETFAYERLRIRTEVRSPNRPLLLENLVLEPGIRPLTSMARMGCYTHRANFYACNVGLPSQKWRELEGNLADICSERSRPGVTIWGATTLVADGVAVQGLSVSGRELPATLTACWKLARRFLTGTEAVPPRKVY